MKNKNTFFTLALIVLVSLSSFAQSLDEIMLKHQTAMGSPEKWAAMNSMIQKNKFNVQGMDIESKTSMLVGKAFRTEIEVMGNKIITVVDGESGWMIRPAMMGGTGEAEDMPREQIKAAISQRNVGSPLLIAKKEGAKIDLINKEKVDGADVYVLKVTRASGDEAKMYVSASTGFVVRTVNKMNVQGQMIDAEVNYSNYKAVDGLYFPFTVETPSPMGGGMMTVETTTIELNPTLDGTLFNKPKK